MSHTASAVKLGYLVSCYPAPSHTFILREIAGLRRHGWQIESASINPDLRTPEQQSAQERAETAATFYLKGQPWLRLLAQGLRVLLLQPLAALSALLLAQSLARPGIRGRLLALCYWLEAVLIAGWMQQRQIGHLHVHFGNEAAMVGLLASHIRRSSWSLTVHGPDEFYDVKGQRLAAKVQSARFVVCISHYARSQLMLLTPPECWSRLLVVPLGVAADFAANLQRPAHLPSRCFTLLCVGRLVSAKGQATLLYALQQLRRWGINARLVLAGDGPDRGRLQRLSQQLQLQQAVEFLGVVSQQQVLEHLGKADVFVLPSFAEGVPVVLMEAMMAGVPCVSTRITGIPELIESGVSGCLVTPGSVAELAQTLKQLANDGSLRRQLAEGGRSRVCHSYNLEANLSRLSDCFSLQLQEVRS